MPVTWREVISPLRAVAVGKECVANGGFETGTLDPWRPMPSEYAHYVKITGDAYEGRYCLSLRPARFGEWCGAYQLINLVWAPFVLKFALKKVSPEKIEQAGCYIGDALGYTYGMYFEFEGLVDELIAFTAYLNHRTVATGTMTKDWNLIVINVRPADLDLIVNGTKIGTLPLDYRLRITQVGLWAVALEYEGGGFLFDSVSLVA